VRVEQRLLELAPLEVAHVAVGGQGSGWLGIWRGRQPRCSCDTSKAWAKDPRWWELRDFFQLLGLTIESGEVRAVRDLRHFLAHQRGELRTDAQRKKFAATHSDLLPPISVELDEQRVLGNMDVLAKAVRDIDAVAWEYAWGGKRLPELAWDE
jgi:hypothetical protein